MSQALRRVKGDGGGVELGEVLLGAPYYYAHEGAVLRFRGAPRGALWSDDADAIL